MHFCYLCVLSRFCLVQFFVTLWALAFQVPLPMGFSRQQYWSGLPFPPPEDFSDPETELSFLICLLHWQIGFLIASATWDGEGNGTPLQHSCLENPMVGGTWWATVHGVAMSRKRLSDFTFTFHFPALEKAMATHSSVLAWRIPGKGQPRGLLSMGSHRVGHD